MLNIVNISLPEEVEKAMDTRASMGALGDMQKNQQYQFAKAMPTLAANSGAGGLAAGGLGVGMAMAQQFGTAQMAPAPQQSQVAAPSQAMTSGGMPPPLPNQEPTFFAVVNGAQAGPFLLTQLRQMMIQGQV